MDPKTVVDYGGTFEALLAHTHFVALLLGIIGGWVWMMVFLFPIKKLCAPAWSTWLNAVSCVVAGIVITLLMWPKTDTRFMVGWSLVIGPLSLALWWAGTHIIGWKWPTLAAALKLKRVSLDTDGNENDVRPSEPGPDPT